MKPIMIFSRRVALSRGTPKVATVRSQNASKSTVNASKLVSRATSIANASIVKTSKAVMREGVSLSTTLRLLLKTKSKHFSSRARTALSTRLGSQ